MQNVLLNLNGRLTSRMIGLTQSCLKTCSHCGYSLCSQFRGSQVAPFFMLWFFGLRMIIQRLYDLCSNPSGWFPKVRGTANTSRDPGLMKWRPTSVVCCRKPPEPWMSGHEWTWEIDDHNSQYPAVQKIEWRWIWEVTTQNLWWVGSPMHLMICVCIPWSTSFCNGDFPYPTKKNYI